MILDPAPAAIASELLRRAGAGALLSNALAAGLRVFAEAYSRTPFVPSPLPETSAPKARGAKSRS